MRDQRRFWLRAATSPAVYSVVGLLLLGNIVARWIAVIGGPAVIRETWGYSAPLISVPAHILLAITPFPSDIVSIANGAVYGFVPGAVLSWVAWWIAALAEYGLGRRARKDFDLERGLQKMPTWLRRFPIEHPAFLIGGRLLPWLGGHITTFFPGAAGVQFQRYVWCSAVAVIPPSIVMAAVGAGLVRL
jgi:uncharacterized membrane protein YdjX (TVP38/TMEM64 family)